MNDLFEIRQTSQMGRGVFAKKQIPTDTKLMDLLERNFLIYQIVAEHQFFGKLADLNEVDMKVHFGFYLAFAEKYKKYEKNYSQKVVRYIENLPKQYHSLICWSQDQLQRIDDKNLIKRATQKKEQLYKDFLKVKDFLRGTSDNFITPNYQYDRQHHDDQEYFNQKSTQSDQTEPEQEPKKIDCKEYKKLSANIFFEDFLNFYTAIETRRVYHQSNYDLSNQLGALVFLLEMFNHYPQGQVKKDYYFLKSIKHIKKDQQIFTSYGDLSNQELFFNYGFVIDEHFHSIKNDFLPDKIGGSLGKQNKKQESCSQIRGKLAQKYNKLYLQKQKKSEQQTIQQKI